MSSDVIEPSPIEPQTSGSAGVSREGWADSTSGDDLNLALAKPIPDPLLGEFHAPPTARNEPLDECDAPNEANRETPSSSSVKVATVPFRVAESPSPPGSYDALTGGVDLSAWTPRTTRGEPEADEDGPDDQALPRGMSLATLLLMSYASAVTIGLVWVLWTGRKARDPVEADPPATVDARLDPGSRAEHSRKIEPRPSVPRRNLVGLGQTVKIGLMEITPLGVSSGTVRLVRNFGAREGKSGGQGALKLRVKLRNTSTDTVLAPLDESFLRDRPGADPDSQIEPDASGSPIAMYPLAIESEWSILGQEFRDLRPGQEFETLLVSAPDSALRADGPMTWRVRLRTGINRTDDLGVRFQPADVKVEPSKKSRR